MNDKLANLVEKLYEIYKSRGFVKEAEILDCADDADLSVFDTNRLIESLTSRGVIIRDDSPPTSNNDQEEYDASKIDYNALFDKAIKIEPSLKTFIEYVRKIQPPQWKEWIGLIPQAKNGNQWAYNRLMEMNLRVVIKNALYYHERYNISLPDAIQEGCIGLMTAIEKFDISEYNSFPGFITRPISQQILRETDFPFLALFNLTTAFRDELYKIFDLVENHQCHICFCGDKYGCENLINDIVIALFYNESEDNDGKLKKQITTSDVYLESARKHLMFFAGYKPIIRDTIIDEDSETAFDIAARNHMKPLIHRTLMGLDSKEEIVLRLRFGFENDSPMALEEVGNLLGVTRERIRQIEQKALNKLKHPSRARKLRDCLYD